MTAGNDRGQVPQTWHVERHPTHGYVWTSAPRPKDGGATGLDSLPPEGVAKNVLTVGSVNDVVGGWTPSAIINPSTFSNYGPTDDGRIKPDVVANGESVTSPSVSTAYGVSSGTSQAAPAVTGALGLLVELLQRYWGADFEPPAALLKALVIHTANDLGTAGPDAKTGFGLVNACAAADLLSLNQASQNGTNVRLVLVQNGGNFALSILVKPRTMN